MPYRTGAARAPEPTISADALLDQLRGRFERTPEQRASGVPVFIEQVMPYFAAGRIRPIIDSVYPLEQLAEAKARMEKNLHVGKIVVVMPA